jgi:hypothetical protein
MTTRTLAQVAPHMTAMGTSIGNIIDSLLNDTNQGKIDRLAMKLGQILGGRVEMYSYNGSQSIVVQPNDGTPQYRIISSHQFLFPTTPLAVPTSTTSYPDHRDTIIRSMGNWRSP